MTRMNVPIAIVQGEQITVTATITGGAVRWPTSRQVYGEVRRTAGSDVLILDLRPYLSVANVGQDTVVVLHLSGAVTRGLVSGGGEYDVFVAEAGAAQDTALCVIGGSFDVDSAVTVGP